MFEDFGFGVFLQVLIDSGDGVSCGFIHIANLIVCTNKFVKDK